MLQNQTIEFVCLSPSEKDKFILYLEDENTKRNRSGEKILKLAYPVEKKDTQEAFNEFFQSPFRVNRFSHVFEGIFAINLTDYLGVNSSSQMLPRLVEYIEENGNMDFVLYAFAKNSSDAETFKKTLPRLFENSGCKAIESPFKSIYTGYKAFEKTEPSNFGY